MTTARRILAGSPVLLAELLDIAGEFESVQPAVSAHLRETVATAARSLNGVDALIDDVLRADSPTPR